MTSNNENITNELLFLSLNEFIKCKGSEKAEYGIDFSSISSDSSDSTFIHKLKDKLPLSYNDSIHLIYYLNLQQSFLERKGYGFTILGIEDIIVIQYNIFEGKNILMFACVNSSYIKKINDNEKIVFTSPFSRKGMFCSPEILALNSIPSSVSYKCFYFSLGALSLYCLNLSSSNDSTFESSSSLFNQIYGTKLYWLIKRIMDNEPNNRVLIMT